MARTNLHAAGPRRFTCEDCGGEFSYHGSGTWHPPKCGRCARLAREAERHRLADLHALSAVHAFAVECPSCEAPPGQPCVWGWNVARWIADDWNATHAARRAAVERALAARSRGCD